MKNFKQLSKYNELWFSVPAYFTMTKPKKSSEEVSQWTGMELRTMSCYLLAVVTNALHCPNTSEKQIFENAIQCTWALLEF
jgi:hypothetical protein